MANDIEAQSRFLAACSRIERAFPRMMALDPPTDADWLAWEALQREYVEAAKAYHTD